NVFNYFFIFNLLLNCITFTKMNFTHYTACNTNFPESILILLAHNLKGTRRSTDNSYQSSPSSSGEIKMRPSPNRQPVAMPLQLWISVSLIVMVFGCVVTLSPSSALKSTENEVLLAGIILIAPSDSDHDRLKTCSPLIKAFFSIYSPLNNFLTLLKICCF